MRSSIPTILAGPEIQTTRPNIPNTLHLFIFIFFLNYRNSHETCILCFAGNQGRAGARPRPTRSSAHENAFIKMRKPNTSHREPNTYLVYIWLRSIPNRENQILVVLQQETKQWPKSYILVWRQGCVSLNVWNLSIVFFHVFQCYVPS